jgi:hypothetical protein
MSIRRTLILLSICLAAAVPSVAHAQFGGGGIGGMGGGMGRGRGGGMGRGGQMPGAPRRAEPLINTVDLILKHGHELALTDSQVTRLTVVKAAQDSTLAVLQARLDSLGGRRERGADQGPAAPGDGDLAGTQPRTQERGEAVMAYRHALEHGRDAAFAVLEKKQRKQTEKLENELKKAMEESEPGRSDRGERGGYES